MTWSKEVVNDNFNGNKREGLRDQRSPWKRGDKMVGQNRGWINFWDYEVGYWRKGSDGIPHEYDE